MPCEVCPPFLSLFSAPLVPNLCFLLASAQLLTALLIPLLFSLPFLGSYDHLFLSPPHRSHRHPQTEFLGAEAQDHVTPVAGTQGPLEQMPQKSV